MKAVVRVDNVFEPQPVAARAAGPRHLVGRKWSAPARQLEDPHQLAAARFEHWRRLLGPAAPAVVWGFRHCLVTPPAVAALAPGLAAPVVGVLLDPPPDPEAMRRAAAALAPFVDCVGVASTRPDDPGKALAACAEAFPGGVFFGPPAPWFEPPRPSLGGVTVLRPNAAYCGGAGRVAAALARIPVGLTAVAVVDAAGPDYTHGGDDGVRMLGRVGGGNFVNPLALLPTEKP